jgi:hypothetical protein
MQFSKTTISLFTQLELSSHCLKSMKGNFSIFPGVSKSPGLNVIEPLWSVLETTVKDLFPLPTSLKQLEEVLREIWGHAVA